MYKKKLKAQNETITIVYVMNEINTNQCQEMNCVNFQIKTSKTNLYIKGLPTEFDDNDIMNLAITKDVVRSVKAAIEDDGHCKGYGFIDFVTPEDAKQGLKHIQVTYPNYTVKFAKENEKDKTNLYVVNLPKSWTSKDSDKLKEWFEKYGDIQSAFIMLEKFQNKPLGVGFVRFFKEEAAKQAITDLEENPIKISEECEGVLEAKFADKHAPDSRRKQIGSSINGNGSLLNGGYNKGMINGKTSVLQSSNQIPLLASATYFDNGYYKAMPQFLSSTNSPNSMANRISTSPSSHDQMLYQQYMLQLAANLVPSAYPTAYSNTSPIVAGAAAAATTTTTTTTNNNNSIPHPDASSFYQLMFNNFTQPTTVSPSTTSTLTNGNNTAYQNSSNSNATNSSSSSSSNASNFFSVNQPQPQQQQQQPAQHHLPLNNCYSNFYVSIPGTPTHLPPIQFNSGALMLPSQQSYNTNSFESTLNQSIPQSQLINLYQI